MTKSVFCAFRARNEGMSRMESPVFECKVIGYHQGVASGESIEMQFKEGAANVPRRGALQGDTIGRGYLYEE